MRQDRADDFFSHTALAEKARAFARVVGRIGPALVIEIMDEAGDAPQVNVLTEMRRVMSHRGFDGQRVLAQRFRLREFRQ